ncbi:MAG: Ryanodine receptor Ryr [Elusimicrobia bacterium]|nr:Ryanodine receptor Ryr [Elusimicrobiota bacterium]
MTYKPKPIETSHVELPKSVRALTEKLAEQVHELWSTQKLADGWVWGPRRDDRRRRHPDLVPYAKLTEEEKEYDRVTALGTIKTILALGYRITKARRRSRS